MILELTFNNYRLFKNANTLSFKADKRTRHLLSNSTPIDGVNVLKALAIYGSNNSGKTNIVSLFEMMKSILASDNNIVCNLEKLLFPSFLTIRMEKDGFATRGVTIPRRRHSPTKSFHPSVTTTHRPATKRFSNAIFPKSV